VPVQTLNGVQMTLVPGFATHAIATIGPEIFVPFSVKDHRMEVELRGELWPFALYQEFPDAPGAKQTSALGWNIDAGARYDFFSGFFFVGRVHAVGIAMKMEGIGQRVKSVNGGVPEYYAGGDILNMDIGLQAGIGFMY
jgi:hypothetical protein